jgi:hypothetical protein
LRLRIWPRGRAHPNPATGHQSHLAPMLEKLDALPEQLGQPETLLADNGYFSEANVMACAAANIEPLIATGRQVLAVPAQDDQQRRTPAGRPDVKSCANWKERAVRSSLKELHRTLYRGRAGTTW